MKQHSFGVIAFFACLFTTEVGRAGLESAMLDAFAAKDAPRVFVSPESTGSTLQLGPPPTLLYDPQNGNLSLELPPVAIDLTPNLAPESGVDFPSSAPPPFLFWASYQVAGVTIEFNTAIFTTSSAESPVLKSLLEVSERGEPRTFAWTSVNNRTDQFEIDTNTLIWNTLLSPVATDPPDAFDQLPAIYAAQVEFGSVLPAGMTAKQLTLLFTPDNGGAAAVASYVNHRRVVSLQQPIQLRVVPEPSSRKLLLAVALIVMLPLKRLVTARCAL